jgi:hypothetical protein
VCLRLPKDSGEGPLLLRDSIEGQRLAEGDRPLTFPVPLNAMQSHARHLPFMRAQVSDSTGRVYLSKPPKRQARTRKTEDRQIECTSS